jgi:hypothetical protein
MASRLIQEELDGLGWRLIVVTSDDLRDAPEAVLNRVRDALIDRGAIGSRRPIQDRVDALLRPPPHLIVFVGLVRNVRNTPPNADVFARLVGNVRPKPAKRSYGCGQIRSSGNWPVTT